MKRLLSIVLMWVFALSTFATVLATTSVASAATSVVASGSAAAIASPTGVNGYTILDQNGGIFNFGTAFYGSAYSGKKSCIPL